MLITNLSKIIEARQAIARRRTEYRETPALLEKVAARLEKFGYLRAIAGNGDFQKLCRASAKAEWCGLCLLIMGPVGCGKTTAAMALRPTWRLVPMGGNLPDDFAAARGERRAFSAWGKEGEFSTGRVILDDLGQEPLQNNYGIKSEMLADYLEYAYDRRETWCYGQPVITTNLSLDAIARRYGARIDSRLAEMCVSVALSGRDKRKAMK